MSESCRESADQGTYSTSIPTSAPGALHRRTEDFDFLRLSTRHMMATEQVELASNNSFFYKQVPRRYRR